MNKTGMRSHETIASPLILNEVRTSCLGIVVEWLVRHAIALLLVVCCYGQNYGGAPGAEIRNEDIIAELTGAIDHWLEKAEFKCTFYYVEGWADSKVEAMRGEMTAVERRAIGSYYKLGDLILHSYSQKEREEGVPPRTGTDFITITDRKLEAYYDFGGGHAQLQAVRRPGELAGTYAPFLRSIPTEDPLHFFGGKRAPNILRFFGEELQSLAPEYRSQITAVPKDDAHMKVHITTERIDDPIEKSSRTLVFWMVPDLPVVVRATDEIVQSSGRRLIFYKHAQDHVLCGSVMIPKRILRVYGDPEANDGWQVRKWISTDLGHEPPRQDDFNFTLAHRTQVFGFKEGRAPNTFHGEVEFDLTAYSVEDLGEPGQQAVPPRRAVTGHFLLGLVIIAMTLLMWRYFSHSVRTS